MKVFRYHNGHQYHQKHHAKALHCFLDDTTREFLVLIAVQAIENDNMQAPAGRRCVRQGERGETGLWTGEGRGWDGQGWAN